MNRIQSFQIWNCASNTLMEIVKLQNWNFFPFRNLQPNLKIENFYKKGLFRFRSLYNSHMTSSSFSSLREPPNNEGSDSNSSTTSISEGSSAFALESGGSKKGGKNAANNPLISDTEKCRVCEEPAARHIHYGATTCFSCRAFFRRSIQVRKKLKFPPWDIS